MAFYIFRLVPEFLMRFLVWLLVHTLYRVRATGLERLPDDGAAIIAPNHVSFVDALIVGGVVRRPVRFVMHHSIFRIPVLNFVFRTARTIPIAGRSEDPALYAAAFADMRAALGAGDLLCLFPEGKLTADGEVDEFRPGHRAAAGDPSRAGVPGRAAGAVEEPVQPARRARVPEAAAAAVRAHRARRRRADAARRRDGRGAALGGGGAARGRAADARSVGPPGTAPGRWHTRPPRPPPADPVSPSAPDDASEDELRPEGVALHRTSLDVRWGDMDALGHVNNIMYFRYFEQARIAWYEGAGFAPLGEADTGMVIVDNRAEYLRPLVYPATMDVRMAGHSPGRSSFVTTYTIAVGRTLYTRGASKIVWVDHAAGRSVPLPDAPCARRSPRPGRGPLNGRTRRLVSAGATPPSADAPARASASAAATPMSCAPCPRATTASGAPARSCGHIAYENPKNVVGCLLEWEGRVLLCRRGIEPRLGLWTLPAGFMENGETTLEGALREAYEEATARSDDLALFGVYDLPRISQVYVMFAGTLKDGFARANEETLEVALFERADVPWDEIAFPVVTETLERWYEGRERGTRRVHHAGIHSRPGAAMEIRRRPW